MGICKVIWSELKFYTAGGGCFFFSHTERFGHCMSEYGCNAITDMKTDIYKKKKDVELL